MTTPATPTTPQLGNSYGPEVLRQPQPGLSHSHPEVVANSYQGQYSLQDGNVSKYDLPPPTAQKRSTISIVLIAVAVAAVVLAGVLGGVLGSKLSSCEDKRSTAEAQCDRPTLTTIPTLPAQTSSAIAEPTSSLAQNYTVKPAAEVESLRNDCPGLNRQQLTTHTGDKFSVTCGFDIGHGKRAEEGEDAVIADILGMVAYSIEDCAAACSDFTRRSNQWETNTECRSFTFNLDLKKSTDGQGGNCWLKNGTVANNSDMRPSKVAVSGKVI